MCSTLKYHNYGIKWLVFFAASREVSGCARQRPGSVMKTACWFLRLLVYVPTQDAGGIRLPSPGSQALCGRAALGIESRESHEYV